MHHPMNGWCWSCTGVGQKPQNFLAGLRALASSRRRQGMCFPLPTQLRYSSLWRWRELLALSRDGIAFVRSGGAKRSQHRTAAPVRTSFLPTDESSATAKTSKNSRDSSSSSKKKNGKEHRKEKSGSEPLAAVAEPAMPVGGTPAGGGGRWIHVPT